MVSLGDSKMNTDTTNTFGSMLKKHREGAKKTLRDLGCEADVPHSVIAAIESGRRSVTTEVAVRLAEALHVKDKDTFLLKAISTTKRQKILPFAKAYRAEVLNSMAIYLANAGILAGDIEECQFKGDTNFATKVMDNVKKGQTDPNFFVSSTKQLGPEFLIATKRGREYTVTVVGERTDKRKG